MITYLGWLAGAAALTGGLLLGGLRSPKTQKLNKRWGGLVVAAVFLLLLSGVYFFGNGWGILNKDYWSILVAAAIMIAGGWLDDRWQLKPGWQLVYQALAALVLLAAGDTIDHVQLPGWGLVYLPEWLNYGLSFGWILIIINAFNWLDGLDGLAGGVGLIGFVIIFFLALTPLVAQPATAGIAIMLAGALLGFLFFNQRPARIYLGSVGAGLIGLMLAVLSLYSGSKVATTGLVLGLPLLDFFYVSFTRIKGGRWPWEGKDRQHLHYRLRDGGWSARRTIFFFYALSAGWGLVALTLQTGLKLLGLAGLALVFAWLAGKLKPANKRKALVLFSGGLDSLLALYLLRDQGFEVTALVFRSPFFEGRPAWELAKKHGFQARVIDFSRQHLAIVKKPRYGRGKNMNPCVDCHLLMLKIAKKIKQRESFDLIATGEVVGQRPMSQNKAALSLIEQRSGLTGQVLRPLSGRKLPATIYEKKGWVKRDRLEAIAGKKRTRQLELAQKYGLKDYATPAGGCLLTDIGFSQRLRQLFYQQPQSAPDDVSLLRYGRLFWLEQGLVMIGRYKEDNDQLRERRQERDWLLELKDYDGPVALIRSWDKTPLPKDQLNEVAATLAWYYPRVREQEQVGVLVKRPAGEKVITIKPAHQLGEPV